MSSSPYPLITALDALTGALFLLTALGVVATRLKTLGKRFIRNRIFDPQPLSNFEQQAAVRHALTNAS
jgi:hypothetical protein